MLRVKYSLQMMTSIIALFDTVDLLKCKTPDFILLSLWPPNSPDLNPVDYKVRGVLQQRVSLQQENQNFVRVATAYH